VQIKLLTDEKNSVLLNEKYQLLCEHEIMNLNRKTTKKQKNFFKKNMNNVLIHMNQKK